MNGTTAKWAAISLATLLRPSVLLAQGCAMCYQNAAGAGSQFIQALRHGILIMFFPPILIMAAILYFAYRRRHQFNSANEGSPAVGAFGEDVPPEWSLADENDLRGLAKSE